MSPSGISLNIATIYKIKNVTNFKLLFSSLMHHTTKTEFTNSIVKILEYSTYVKQKSGFTDLSLN